MTLDDYQAFCSEAIKEPVQNNPLYFAVGLAGECGEVTEIIKKSVRDSSSIDETHLLEEVGDVLWYLANICTQGGLRLQAVIDRNVAKLRKRYPGQYREIEYYVSDSRIGIRDKKTKEHLRWVNSDEAVPDYIIKTLLFRQAVQHREAVPDKKEES